MIILDRKHIDILAKLSTNIKEIENAFDSLIKFFPTFQSNPVPREEFIPSSELEKQQFLTSLFNELRIIASVLKTRFDYPIVANTEINFNLNNIKNGLKAMSDLIEDLTNVEFDNFIISPTAMTREKEERPNKIRKLS